MKRLSPVCALAAMLAVAGRVDLSAQCAMCRRALESPEAQQLAGALRSGILVLLAAPFLSFGIVAVLAVRSQRRSALAAVEPPTPNS